MEEEWKDIPGWEGMYQVSNMGRVKGLERDVWIPDNKQSPGYYRTYKEKIVKPKLESNGYLRLTLWKDSKYKMFSVHTLVCMAWMEYVPTASCCINHKNGVKTDNRPENLEVVTYKENMAHAIKSGLRRTGFDYPDCKINLKTAREVLAMRQNGVKISDIALHYGVSTTTIKKAIKRFVDQASSKIFYFEFDRANEQELKTN